jgi:AcrR family transcriptional regulator
MVALRARVNRVGDTIITMAEPSGRPAVDTVRESLREAQRRLTRERIVAALAALIEEQHPFEVSMAEVASRAHVSEPTLYRHFPTKRDLFAALAGMQYRRVTEGIDPTSVHELVSTVRTVYRRAEEMEPVVRWTLAGPDPERVPRPNVAAKLAMLRSALADATANLTDRDSELLLRVVVLLTSPMAWLYWRDYLELESDTAADTAAWAIERLTRTQHP